MVLLQQHARRIKTRDRGASWLSTRGSASLPDRRRVHRGGMIPYPKYATAVIGAHSVPDWYESLDRLNSVVLRISCVDRIFHSEPLRTPDQVQDRLSPEMTHQIPGIRRKRTLRR